jgi:hypothetical protein
LLSRLALVVATASSLVLLLPAARATAAGEVNCPPIVTICTVQVENPGNPSANPQDPPVVNVSDGQCVTFKGSVVPCWTASFGWFNSTDSCYYKNREPQPPSDDLAWDGHYPDGAIYVVSCAESLNAPGTNGGWAWLPGPPDGYGGAPGQLAQQAVEQLALEGPAIRTPLDGKKIGTVGIPLWLWTEQGVTTWGPATATATVPSLSVTATAQAKWIDWDLGDGS